MVIQSKWQTALSAADVRRVGGKCRFVSCFIADSVALSAVRGENGPEHPDSGFRIIRSTTQRLAKLIQQTEEHMLPRIPRQQPIDYPPPRRKNLHRNPHHRNAKRAKVHPQQLPFLLLVQVPPTARLRQHQRAPGLQTPGQRSHHHVALRHTGSGGIYG